MCVSCTINKRDYLVVATVNDIVYTGNGIKLVASNFWPMSIHAVYFISFPYAYRTVSIGAKESHGHHSAPSHSNHKNKIVSFSPLVSGPYLHTISRPAAAEAIITTHSLRV